MSEDRKDRKERIEELYENLYGYLLQIKKLSPIEDKIEIKKLFKLFLTDSGELGDLLIQEGKDTGQIDNDSELEMRNYHLEMLKEYDKIIEHEMDIMKEED
jgi:hypothetical protein